MSGTDDSDKVVGDWQPRSKITRKLIIVWNFTVTWREIVEKMNTCKTSKRVEGLARTTKPTPRHGQGLGKARQRQCKSKLCEGKDESKNKGKDKQHGKKERISRNGHEDKQETQTGQEHRVDGRESGSY